MRSTSWWGVYRTRANGVIVSHVPSQWHGERYRTREAAIKAAVEANRASLDLARAEVERLERIITQGVLVKDGEEQEFVHAYHA